MCACSAVLWAFGLAGVVLVAIAVALYLIGRAEGWTT